MGILIGDWFKQKGEIESYAKLVAVSQTDPGWDGVRLDFFDMRTKMIRCLKPSEWEIYYVKCNKTQYKYLDTLYGSSSS